MQVRQEVDSSGWAWLRITVCILQGYSERYTTEALSGPPLLMAQACPSAACRCSYPIISTTVVVAMGAVRYATAPFPLTPVWPLQYPLHSTDSLLCLTLPPVSDSKPAVHLVLVPLLHRRSLSSYPPSSFSSIRTLLKKCVSCLRPRNHAPVLLSLSCVRSCCTLFPPPPPPPRRRRAGRPKLPYPPPASCPTKLMRE